MRVAHLLSSFGLGGQERVALDLARQQRRDDFEVLAISLAGDPAGPMASAFASAGVPTRSLSRRAGLDATLPLRLAWLLRRERVDVVHTHNPQALVYGAPAARMAGIPVLHSKHGINPDPPRRMRLRRVAARFVDAYVAVTPTLAEIARVRHECAPERLRVVPNGIDVAPFSLDAETRRRVRRELDLPDDAWVVGSVGRLSPEKDHALLLDALAPELGRLSRLVLVGDGPELKALIGQAGRQARLAWVHFTGMRNDVPRLLAAFDAFALSSRTEGLPLVLLEAMAASLPVVATRVGGVADLVEDALTGHLVPPGDARALREALRWLAHDPERAREMGRLGRERVLAHHTLEHMARGYQALYAEISSRRRVAPMATFAGARAP